MYKIIILVFIISFPNLLLAQEQKDFTYYNNETYRLYQEANWESLAKLGKEGLSAGHDFYYMRMRIGIAFYEQQKYIQAIPQFEKALEFTPGSQDAMSYLYYCHIYLGRTNEAKKYYDINEEEGQFISSLAFEPGIKLSDNKAYTRDTRYAFFGLGHNISKSISLFHGYQRLVADFALPPDQSNPIPGPSGGINGNETIYSVKQNEYYAALTILAGKGFYLIPAYHFQDVKSDTYHGRNNVFSFQLAKWLGKLKLYGGVSFSEINDLNQQQYEGGLVLYPMGNYNLFFQTQATYHSENSNSNIVSFSKVGFKLFSTTWIDFSYSYGDMINYSDMNGYVVYNQLDVITSKWGITLNQSIGKHFLYLNYTKENKEEYLTGTPFAHNDIILGLNLVF